MAARHWKTRVVVASVIASCAGVARAKDPDWRLELASGGEVDTNIHRVEKLGGMAAEGEIESAPLVRLGGRSQVSWLGSGRRLVANGFLGTKVFATESSQGENVAIVSGDARFDQSIGQGRTMLGVLGSYYNAVPTDPFDSLQPSLGRNFRYLSGDALLSVPGPESHRVTASFGGRDFHYKPDSRFDWKGTAYGLQYGSTFWRGDPDADPDAVSIDLLIGYRLGLRSFTGNAFRNRCGEADPVEPSCFVETTEGRFDLHHRGAAEVVVTGDRLYSAEYVIELNDSNSAGPYSTLRQRVELGITSALGAGFFLTGSGVVRLNVFLDKLLLARDIQSQSFISIDDENRNSLSLHLAKDLWAGWSAETRYGIFSNEFTSSDLSYRRQIFYLGLLYAADSRDE